MKLYKKNSNYTRGFKKIAIHKMGIKINITVVINK